MTSSASTRQRPSSDDDPCYVTYRPCGCVAGITVDRGDKLTAKFIADEIRAGCHAQRMTIGAGRAELKGVKWGPCIHEQQPAAASGQESLAL